MTYEDWLKRQNRRWKGKRYRKHPDKAELDRRVAKATQHLIDHGH